MSNRYSSINRTIIARNLLVKAFAPPADFAVADTDLVRNAFCFAPQLIQVPYNPQSNLFLNKVGIFCNYADGLVFDGTGFDIQISALAVTSYNLLTGDISVTAGSNALTADLGTGAFTTELAVGSLIKNTIDNAPYMVVQSITDDDNAVLTDNVEFTQVSQPASWQVAASTAGAVPIYYPRMTVFNHMMAFEQFLNPVIYSLTGSLFDIVLTARLTSSSPTSMNFKTLTIDPAFAGQLVRMHVVADIEFTAS